jgi:MFS family permease
MLRCQFLPCSAALAIVLVLVLEPGPAAGFVAPFPTCHPPTLRFNAAHASRRSYVAARALSALRGQQQVEEKDQADVPGTASLFRGASFPPPFLLPFLVPATGGALFGYDIGATSSVTRILGENPGSFGDLGAGEIGLIASGSLLGAMFASTLLIGIGDKQIGRKLELNLAAGLYALGTVLQVVAGSVPALVAGRILYGLGIGTAMHVAPLYIGETAPNDLRGKLVSLKEAAIVLGIVAGYATGAVFGSGDSPAWQPVYGCALPVAALMLAGVQTLPESARWLALRGREKEAIEAVVQLQGAQGSRADAEQQVAEMMAIASKQALAKEAAGSNSLFLHFSILFAKETEL